MMGPGAIWQKLPKGFRVFAGLGIVAAMLGFGLAVGFFAWHTSDLPARLGLEKATPVTKQDISEQTREITTSSATAVQDVVREEIGQYDLELRDYLQAERRSAIDTILNPMLSAFAELDKRQRQMQQATDANARRLEEIPKAYGAQLERLMQASEGDQTMRMIREVLERLDAIEQERNAPPAGGGRNQSKMKL